MVSILDFAGSAGTFLSGFDVLDLNKVQVVTRTATPWWPSPPPWTDSPSLLVLKQRHWNPPKYNLINVGNYDPHLEPNEGDFVTRGFALSQKLTFDPLGVFLSFSDLFRLNVHHQRWFFGTGATMNLFFPLEYIGEHIIVLIEEREPYIDISTNPHTL